MLRHFYPQESWNTQIHLYINHLVDGVKGCLMMAPTPPLLISWDSGAYIAFLPPSPRKRVLIQSLDILSSRRPVAFHRYPRPRAEH